MDADELQAMMAEAQNFEKTGGVSGGRRRRQPRRGRNNTTSSDAASASALRNPHPSSSSPKPLSSNSASSPGLIAAPSNPDDIDAALFGLASSSRGGGNSKASARSHALPVALDTSLAEDGEEMTEVERQIAARMKSSGSGSSSSSSALPGRKSGKDVYAEMMRKKKALEEKSMAQIVPEVEEKAIYSPIPAPAEAHVEESSTPTNSTPMPASSTAEEPTTSLSHMPASVAAAPVPSAFAKATTEESLALASAYKPRAGRRAATAGRRARHASSDTPATTPPSTAPSENLLPRSSLSIDVKVERPYTTAGSIPADSETSPEVRSATSKDKIGSSSNNDSGTKTIFDPYIPSPMPHTPVFQAQDYSHLPYKEKFEGRTPPNAATSLSESKIGRSALSTSGRKGNTSVNLHSFPSSPRAPLPSAGLSNEERERLMQTIRAQEQSIADLNQRKSQLVNELHQANMNANEMVGATKSRYVSENDRDVKRVQHEMELRTMELTAERNKHDDTRRKYEDRIKVMTMELGYIKSKVASELEVRFQEQLEYSSKMHSATLEQQKMHYERELQSLRQAHMHEIDSLRRQTLDSAYLKQLAQKIEASQSKMAELSSTVQREKSTVDDAHEKQLRIREQHVHEKESKLNERVSNHNMLVSAFENLKSEHSDERSRLKEEYSRVQQLQRDLNSQSEIFREQLTSERDLLQKERIKLRNDKEAWVIERQQESSQHQGNQEMVARMKTQLTKSLEDAKVERSELARQLDGERRELSTLKRVLDERKRVLDERHEQAIKDEELCARKSRYVESKMAELAEFGAKIKAQSANIARSWKKLKRDESVLENNQRMLSSTQSELAQKFADLDSRQRILDQERAVFERRRLDLLRDQQQFKNSLTTNDRLLQTASVLNVHMDSTGNKDPAAIQQSTAASSSSTQARSRSNMLQSQMKLHQTLRAAELKRKTADDGKPTSSVTGLSQSQRLANDSGTMTFQHQGMWAGRSVDHIHKLPMASATPTLDSVFTKNSMTGEVNLNQVALDVLLRDMESEASGIQEMLHNENLVDHHLKRDVAAMESSGSAPTHDAPSAPSPTPTTASAVSWTTDRSPDDAKSVQTIIEHPPAAFA